MIVWIEDLYVNHQLAFWIIGLVVAWVISWFFARNAKAKISYCCHHNNIVKNNKTSIDGLKIKFKNKPIETLSVSRFLIFNSGKKVLMGSDVSSNDMFGIKLTKGEILAAKIINNNDDFSKPQLKLIGKSKMKINFHHINPRGAVLVQLAHTAPGKDGVQLVCCAAGLNKVKRVSANKPSLRACFIAGFGLLFYAIMFILLLFNKSTYKEYLSTCNPAQMARQTMWMAGICIVILLLQFLYSMGGRWKWSYWGRFLKQNNFWDSKN